MDSSKEDSSVNLDSVQDNEEDEPSVSDTETPYADSDGIEKGKDDEKEQTCLQKTWKWVRWFMNRYFIVALTGMSQGLFVTLIAGTIIKQFGKLFGEKTRGGSMFIDAGNIASLLTGAGIGAGIAKSLDSSNLVIFATVISGVMGAFSDKFIERNWIIQGKVAALPGNPIGSYINSVIGCEIGNLVVRLHTRLDILLVPLFIIIASIGGCYVCWPFRTAGTYIADGIAYAMDEQPIVMSIVMSVWIGLLLTLPTSSAATCISLQIRGLAGGAACAGCCSHMIGFAVASFRENGWRGLISQGIGTSMIQIPNLVRHPLIIVPEVITSIIMGPIAAMAFKLETDSTGSGMGTAGLVGLFATIEGSGGKIPAWKIGVGIALCHFVLPAILNIAISEFMRWRGWIKFGQQKLD